ncbi:hypothetical protein GGR50DRAFT_584860 [Xylaria sp. CBS 124048]|nr:hypothetical protein GGR50DRAFT_584860 [Xylaria sp. CBS 124048]
MGVLAGVSFFFFFFFWQWHGMFKGVLTTIGREETALTCLFFSFLSIFHFSIFFRFPFS